MAQTHRIVFSLFFIFACAFFVAHAEQTESPGSQLQDALNDMHDFVMADPVELKLEAAEQKERAKFEERTEAYLNGQAEWYPGEAKDVSMLEMDKKKAVKAKGKKNFDKEVQTMVKQGLITADVGKRILALKSVALKNKKSKKAAKGKKGSKKNAKGKKKAAKKVVAGTGISRGGNGKVSQGKFVADKKKQLLADENGNPLRSIQLAYNKANSGCFACQYFVQRTLGALLGPFYSPANAGPYTSPTFVPVAQEEHSAEPLNQWKQYASTNTAPESLTSSDEAKEKFIKLGPYALPHTAAFIETDVDAEVDTEAEAETEADMEMDMESGEMSAIEIEAIAYSTFEVPEPSVAMSQYNKWYQYLPEHMRSMSPVPEEQATSLLEVESESETDTEAEADADSEAEADSESPKKKKKANKPKKNFSKALKSSYGQLYTRRQRHAVKSFFSDLCNRRVPPEFQSTCSTIYKNLDAILEELSTGDRADEVCIRHKMCPASSYVKKATHTLVRLDM